MYILIKIVIKTILQSFRRLFQIQFIAILIIIFSDIICQKTLKSYLLSFGVTIPAITKWLPILELVRLIDDLMDGNQGFHYDLTVSQVMVKS